MVLEIETFVPLSRSCEMVENCETMGGKGSACQAYCVHRPLVWGQNSSRVSAQTCWSFQSPPARTKKEFLNSALAAGTRTHFELFVIDLSTMLL